MMEMIGEGLLILGRVMVSISIALHLYTHRELETKDQLILTGIILLLIR